MEDVEQPDLAQEEANARVAKLRAERYQIELQTSRSARRLEILKALAGLGAVLTGLAAVAALLYSILQGVGQLNRERDVRIEERLDSALKKASASTRLERLSGVISLKSFLEVRDSDRQKRVLLALAHFLSIEEDAAVRAAVVEVFRDIDSTTVAPVALESAAKALVGLSRSLSETGKLNRKNMAGKAYPYLFDRDLNARSVGASLVAVLRAGAKIRDLSGIYCARCDFSRLKLDGTSFDDAVLIQADFGETSLVRASFDRADLEATRFIKADLRDAKILTTSPKWVGGFSIQSAWDGLADGLIRVGMPDFSCADLRGADFAGRILFGLVRRSTELIYPSNFEAAKFRHAKLAGTDLRRVGVFGVDPATANPKLPFTTRSSGGSGVHTDRREGKTYWSFQAQLDEDSVLTDAATEYKENLEEIAFAFSATDWREAKLPKALRALLTETERESGASNLGMEWACDLTRPIL